MKVISYKISLCEPVLVSTLGGDPNSAVAHEFIPGSVLRGAVIGKYLRDHPGDFDAGDSKIRDLFFNGSTCYLNAYPAIGLGKRTLPLPLSLRHEKGETQPIFDFAVNEDEDIDNEKQWESESRNFGVFSEGDRLETVEAKRHFSLHVERDRECGRSRKDSGAVYRYEALAPEQDFFGIVICHKNNADCVVELLKGMMYLGKARTAGYGRAQVEVDKPVSHADWRETGDAPLQDINGILKITFLSDALLRDDENGQFAVTSDTVKLAVEKRIGVKLECRSAYFRGRQVGGFNRKWGLPLPQAMAVQMGSAFVFSIPACAADTVRQLEAIGMGDRLAEGYGRVAVNWQNEPKLKVQDGYKQPSRPVNISSPEDQETARGMVERILRLKLNGVIMEKASSKDVKNKPEKSQLTRLRGVIHDELMRKLPDTERIRRYLEDIKKRSIARKQFERTKIGESTLSEWIENKLKLEDAKEILDDISSDVSLGGIKADLQGLKTEYALRLIDAVLARMAKS